MKRKDLYKEASLRVRELAHWIDNNIEIDGSTDSLSMIYCALTVLILMTRQPPSTQTIYVEELHDWLTVLSNHNGYMFN